MTTYTLMTVIALALGVASWCATVVLAVLLVWTGRRVGDVQSCYAELDALAKQVKNLDDQLDHYRKRDAVRQSRRKKEAETEEETPAEEPTDRDELVARFERRGR